MTAILERKEYCKQRAELIKYWRGGEGKGREGGCTGADSTVLLSLHL